MYSREKKKGEMRSPEINSFWLAFTFLALRDDTTLGLDL